MLLNKYSLLELLDRAMGCDSISNYNYEKHSEATFCYFKKIYRIKIHEDGISSTFCVEDTKHPYTREIPYLIEGLVGRQFELDWGKKD